MGERYGSTFICEDPDELNPELDNIGWLWIKPSTGQMFKWNSSVWEEQALNFKDIVLSGSITTDGQAGLSGTKVTPIGTLTFTNGILTGFEPA